jgi:hypothetical protein
MSTLTRATAYTVRIAAITAATPMLAGAAVGAATAKLAGWELRQLASSPLSAEARRLRAEYLVELAAANGAGATTAARQQEHVPIARAPAPVRPVPSWLPRTRHARHPGRRRQVRVRHVPGPGTWQTVPGPGT